MNVKIQCSTCKQRKQALPGIFHNSDLLRWRAKPLTTIHCAHCKNLKNRDGEARRSPWRGESIAINPAATAAYREKGAVSR